MNCSPLGFSVYGILQTRTLSGLPFPSREDLPDPRIEHRFPASQAASLPFELRASPGTAVSLFSLWASQVVLVVKNPPANAGDIRDIGSIPALGRSPRRGNISDACMGLSSTKREQWLRRPALLGRMSMK